MTGKFLAFGVLGMPAGDLPSKQAIKSAGCTHTVIVANWGSLQPNGPGTALDPTALGLLQADFDQAAEVGLKVMFEVALHYPPSWVYSGGSAAEQFKDQFGNVYNAAGASSGEQVANWQWTALGRTYVSDLIAKVAAGLGTSRVAQVVEVKCGGGYYGENHYPVSTAATVTHSGCAFTNGSPIVTDPSIASNQQGLLIASASSNGIPSVSYVGTVVPGVSYLLSSSSSSQVNVNATLGSSGVSIRLGSVSFWCYGTSMQTGTGLASGMAVCPNPGYVLWSGTDAQDGQILDWYLNGLATWILWFIAQMRAAGFVGDYHVCHPGGGIRSNYNHANSTYRSEAGLGQDPARIIGAYAHDPKIWPYCTDLNNTDAANPPVVDSDLSYWKKVYEEAVRRNKHFKLWGENAGGENATTLGQIFAGYSAGSALSGASWNSLNSPFGTYGYQGIFWLNYASLTTGGGAQLSDLQTAIAAHTATL